MNLMCRMFGHRVYKGWWGDGLYGDVHVGGKDGIGRGHATVTLECDRCRDTYIAARFHADPDKLMEALND